MIEISLWVCVRVRRPGGENEGVQFKSKEKERRVLRKSKRRIRRMCKRKEITRVPAFPQRIRLFVCLLVLPSHMKKERGGGKKPLHSLAISNKSPHLFFFLIIFR